MKKLSTLLLSLFVTGASFGQSVPSHVQKRVETLTKARPMQRDVEAPAPVAKSSAAVGDTIAYYDFNGGLQGWTATNNSGPADWVYSTTGSSGQYSSSAPINSTTSGNGFLLLDCDGANTPTPAAGFSDVDAWITSPVIDLTNEPGVVIEFQENFRPFSTAELVLAVSDDGGSTWTEFDVRGDVASNAGSANPVTQRILVSQVIGGSSQARLRFHWRNSSHYVWMVDDVLLLKQPATDLGVNDVFFNTTADTAERNLYYTQIPLRHANVDEITVGTNLSNISLANQTNVTVSASINKAGGGFSSSVTSTPFNWAGTTSRVDTAFDFTTPLRLNGGLGDYTFELAVASDSTDQIPGDNLFSQDITVSDTVYSRDIDQISFISQRVPQEILANYYEILRPDTVTSVTIRIGNPGSLPGSSSIGSVVKVYLYDSTLSTPVSESAFYTINNTGFHTIPLTNETAVSPGAWYAGFEVISDSAWLAIDGDRTPPFFTTYENIGGVLGTGGTWYFANFTSVPWIRMNVKPFNCPDFQATASVTDATCGQTDGAASITPGAGQAPYTYTWSTGDQGNSISNVGSGTYEVTISDAVGCSDVEIVNIVDAGAPTIASSNVVIDSCFNSGTGEVSISATGGTGALTIQWNTGATSSSITGLTIGSYTVTVTDSLGCRNIETFQVGGPTAPLGGTFQQVSQIACNGDENGELTVNVTGGTAPYSYAWSNGENTAVVSNLGAGTYQVTITDVNGCLISGQNTLSEPTALFIGGAGVNYTNQNENATIGVAISGGTAPYSYAWSGPNGFTSSQQNISLQGADQNGNYTVQVTDDNACTESRDFLVDGLVSSVLELNGQTLLTLFPNPSNGQFSINGENINGEYTLQVQDILGAVVYTNEVNFANSNVVTVDLTEQQKGVYFVQLLNANGELEYMNRIIIK